LSAPFKIVASRTPAQAAALPRGHARRRICVLEKLVRGHGVCRPL